MHRPTHTSSWESELRSYQGTETWPKQPPGVSKLQTSPRPAHMTQSSSPSFLEAYAKYVEQKRDADRSKRSSDQESPLGDGQRIRAFSRETSEGRDARSLDARKDGSDSDYSSWPASLSPVSPNLLQARTSAESLPSPTAHTASRFRHDDFSPAASGAQRSGILEESETHSRGSVAAAVDALEVKFRESGPATPRRNQPLLSIPDNDTLDKLQTSSAPSSPWPNVAYDPSPRRNFSVEVCVVPPPEEDDGGGGREMAALDLDSRLAAIFERQPELRAQLVRLLNDSRRLPDGSLGVQVQELMKDHPELVAALNAQFSRSLGGNAALRQALLSTASMHLEEERQQQPQSQAVEGEKTYMVVMRGIPSSELEGIKADLQRHPRAQGGSWSEAAKWLVPPGDKRYFPWVTIIAIASVLCIFFFMAGGYAGFVQQTTGTAEVSKPYLPFEMGQWLDFSPAWRKFDFDYLLLWGGQYLPAIHGNQNWRWVTAAFLHVSFMHLLGNMLLFAVLGGILEQRYGAARVLLVLVVATFGAAFFAGAFADGCTQVVGASGAVLGFVGLTLADLIVNFGDLRSAVMRLVITTAAIIFFIVTAVSKAGEFTSNYSHLGGFVCGLFPSFLFLPNLKDRRWRRAQKLAARIAALRHGSRPVGARQEGFENPDRSRALIADPGPASILSPHPMRSLSAWLDGPAEALQHAARAAAGARPPQGGVPLPGMAGRGQNPRTSRSAPVHSHAEDPTVEQQPGSRLFTEEPSDGPFVAETAASSKCAAFRNICRSWLCPWSCAVLPLAVLGAVIMIGVFAGLPTYIYVVRLPRLECP